MYRSYFRLQAKVITYLWTKYGSGYVEHNPKVFWIRDCRESDQRGI